MCSLHHCSKLRIDLSVTHVASLTTPISTSAQDPSAPEQNFTSAQSPKNAILSGCNGRNIIQVALEGCSSVTRHPFHASICSRSPELNLQFEKPLHGQSRFVDSRASTSGSQTCSLLLPSGNLFGPFMMGCAGVRSLTQRHTEKVSNNKNVQDCNESDATILKTRELATQTMSVCGRDHPRHQDMMCLESASQCGISAVSETFSSFEASPKAGPPIRSRRMVPHPTGEKALVHLRTRLFRYAVLGGFNVVVSNHHVNVKPRHAALGP